jgi:hypothetical protein
MGNVTLNFNLDKETWQGLLHGVYYIPALQGNLFSLTHLTKWLHKTISEDNACCMYNPAGQLTAIGCVHGDNLNTTQTLEYIKDKYNAKIRK